MSFNSSAQRCGGKFFFRIYDSNAKLVYPILSDTIRYLDNGIKKNKISGDFAIKNIDTKGNGTFNVQLIRYSSTPLYLYFSTGCFTELKKISIKKDNEEMILNFCSIPSEVDILFDSIKFIPGELTYNISQIIDSNRISYNIRTPENNSPWEYIIPCNLIQIGLTRPIIQEFKNDTLYNYSDSLKTKLISKGKVKIHKTTVTYYRNAWEMKMNENLKRKQKHKIISYLKRGTWTYYFDNYTLQRKEKEKMERKIEKKIYSKMR